MIKQICHTIFLLLIGINLLQGQKIELPENIILTHQHSGAIRKSGTINFYLYKDSIEIHRDSFSNFYQIKEYHSRNRKAHRNREVLYDSISTISTDLNINKTVIEELLSLLDTSMYKSTAVLLSTSDLDSNDTQPIYCNGPLIPNDFSSKYFFNSTNITTESDSLYLDNILKSNLGIRVISSHKTFLIITLKFNNKTIKFFQNYPGNANFKWFIVKHETTIDIDKELLNPRINDIIYQIIPPEITWRNTLIEYKDHEDLFEVIRY